MSRPDHEIKYGDDESYLYHHIDNEKPIIPLIALSCFLFICNNGLAMILIVWVIYFVWADNNNKKLDRDPNVLKRREYIKQARKQLGLK
ncbi:MAG: hypothetical protein IJ455_02770 [Agathobacter sp.]|nr:hypothetical protein [Agathobacter sp.]